MYRCSEILDEICKKSLIYTVVFKQENTRAVNKEPDE